jgi:hypothetical protein
MIAGLLLNDISRPEMLLDLLKRTAPDEVSQLLSIGKRRLLRDVRTAAFVEAFTVACERGVVCWSWCGSGCSS